VLVEDDKEDILEQLCDKQTSIIKESMKKETLYVQGSKTILGEVGIQF
jgi:hypothetical protein